MEEDHSPIYKNGGGNRESMNSNWWQAILATTKTTKTNKKQSKDLPMNEDTLLNLSIFPSSKSVSCMKAFESD